MSVSTRSFGFTRGGEPVCACTLVNDRGMSCTLLDYGAVVQSLCVPNRAGGLTDVVLGYDSVAEYERGSAFIGATIGRFANRLGGARFSLNGHEYRLDQNDGDNCLHGGRGGFHTRVWRMEAVDEYAVRLSRLSPDGEEGFPGNLELAVTFRLSKDVCALHIDYDAVSDADTLVNLTNHSYFDLSGCGRAMEQTLCIHAARFLALGAGTLPDGRILPVDGTPFDFRTAKPVGRDVDAEDAQLRLGGGYDHNFCLSGPLAAELASAETGIQMQLLTDMPGMQLYSGNFLDEQRGKGGRRIFRRCAVALETQLWPDAMNHWGFPSPVLRAGERLHSSTCCSFDLIG